MTVKQPINYLDFNNPVHVIWRKGTPNDPYIDRLDITRVANQRVALLEIPDELYRVRIANMFEINYEKFIKTTIGKNEFYCDYTNGFVYFHSNMEAETVSIVYKGRGMLLYPSTRVVHHDGKDVTQSLSDIIDQSKVQVEQLINRTENFEEVLERMVIATNLTTDATDVAISTSLKAEQHIDLIKDAYETTVLIYQPYVQTESDIKKKYPIPQVGWVVQVFDTGVRYRWNGKDWIPIDALGGNIPTVTEFYDGLMSKEDFVKLKDISEETDYKTIVFVCPQDVVQGIQDPHIVFPYDGEIKEISAFVSKKGTVDTTFELQKSTDLETWNSVTEDSLVILANNHRDNGVAPVFKNEKVSKNDVFRLFVSTFNSDAYNLTVNITIQIN